MRGNRSRVYVKFSENLTEPEPTALAKTKSLPRRIVLRRRTFTRFVSLPGQDSTLHPYSPFGAHLSSFLITGVVAND
jgi:hypothetical protein